MDWHRWQKTGGGGGAQKEGRGVEGTERTESTGGGKRGGYPCMCLTPRRSKSRAPGQIRLSDWAAQGGVTDGT